MQIIHKESIIFNNNLTFWHDFCIGLNGNINL